MLDIDLLVRLYEYFYKNYFSLSSKYKFTPKESNLKNITSFLSNIDNSKGFDFIWKYLIFQFNYYSELELVNNHGKLSTKYIFGKSSYKRWLERNTDFDFLLEFNNKVNKSFFQFPTVNYEGISSLQIQKKKKFHNTDFGFTYCLENTDLYNQIHLPCLLCNKKQICKEISDNYLKNAETKK